MNDIEKLKSMSRLKTIKLKDADGTMSEYKIRSMKPYEILAIMNTWGDKSAKELEGMTPEEMEMRKFTEYVASVVDASKSIMKRTYPELNNSELEEVISSNLQIFMEYTSEQMSRFFHSDDTRNVKRLRHAKKKAKGES